jgi:phage terminase large subunit-like protein
MLADRKTAALVGSPSPRIAPPLPLRHDLVGYRAQSVDLDIDPMPWQDTAATYLTATDLEGRWLFRDVAVVVGRQNGKTTLTKPLIVQRLKAGRKVMHIAQVRELPRIMFESIADALEDDPTLFPKRRGKIIWPRRGAGSESIILTNGGTYRIAAAITGSARGHSIDDLLIDELREMESFDVINSAKPAQRFSENPQTIYLSNAGTDDSVVLNSLRTRGEAGDPSLAYLEWSADPDYDPGDVRGWVQANPSIGHFPQVLTDLEKDYVSADEACPGHARRVERLRGQSCPQAAQDVHGRLDGSGRLPSIGGQGVAGWRRLLPVGRGRCPRGADHHVRVG